MVFAAITTMEQLAQLDEGAMVEGYRAGFDDAPNYTRRDQAYWHGYLNGQVDSGRMPISAEQSEFARVYVAAQRAQPV